MNAAEHIRAAQRLLMAAEQETSEHLYRAAQAHSHIAIGHAQIARALYAQELFTDPAPAEPLDITPGAFLRRQMQESEGPVQPTDLDADTAADGDADRRLL